MKRIALGLISILTLGGCVAETPRTSPTPSVSATPNPSSDGLPTPVAQKRETILRAGEAMDYDTLEASLDPKTFSYSFGEGGDPIGAWRQHEEDGQSPVRDILPVLLRMPYGLQSGIYMWPRMASYEPDSWTAEDRATIKALYDDDDVARFEESGSYVGYRVGIEADGTWIFFIAGD